MGSGLVRLGSGLARLGFLARLCKSQRVAALRVQGSAGLLDHRPKRESQSWFCQEACSVWPCWLLASASQDLASAPEVLHPQRRDSSSHPRNPLWIALAQGSPCLGFPAGCSLSSMACLPSPSLPWLPCPSCSCSVPAGFSNLRTCASIAVSTLVFSKIARFYVYTHIPDTHTYYRYIYTYG